jgi:diguanylate cyclase (GGDEF)-like protein/PAS domain S-box-containing protein
MTELNTGKRTNQNKYSGAGFAIIKNIVKRHDGRISVESAPSAGYEDGKLLHIEREQQMTATILVIDDNEDDQCLYRHALKDFNYELIPALSAQAGLARIADLKPDLKLDLILLDYNLPDMDGLVFMKRLAEYPDMHIPIVMLTSEGSEAVAVEAMKNGADDYLVKDTSGQYLKLLPGIIEYVMAAHAQRVHTRRLMALHQAILDTVEDGIIGINIAGDILFANPAAERMLAPRQGLVGRPVAQLLWCGENQCDWSSHPLAAAPKGATRFYRNSDFFHRENGQTFPVAYNASAIDLRGNGGAWWVLVFQDMSERKKADALLRQHELVIETTNDGFWMNSLSGHLIEVNQAYADMMGYTREELIGMHISQLSLMADTPEQVKARIERIVAQGFDRFETRHRHKDGHLIDFDASVTYLAEAKCLFSFLRDITGRKKTEEALRVAAVTFETHDAIMITDVHANIIRVNKAFTDITGYSPEEVFGKNPSIMSSGQHDKTFYTEMWQQLIHSGSWSGEIWDKRKNGQVYPKWVTITAVKNEQQETTQYVAIFSDITERKRIEEEICNLAFYDDLTKLPNRRLFLDRFRAALPVSARYNIYGAVLFIDLDKFKMLNDTLGHDYGDLLLMEVAYRIKLCVRKMDTVARLGGDEFVVLIEGLNENEEEALCLVEQVAEKIRETLARPYRLKKHTYRCSPSIGVSLYRGIDESVDVLLQHADLAMYQAKEAGRNAVRFF